jgi:hypothetical protein
VQRRYFLRNYSKLGAIAGDATVWMHEGAGTRTKQFPLLGDDCRFADGTVLTVAVGRFDVSLRSGF